MEPKPTQLKFLQSFFKILVLALLLCALSAAALVSIGSSRFRNPDFTSAMLIIAIIFAVVITGLSYPFFARKLEKAKTQTEFTERLEGYRAACILQMAMNVGPTLFAIIAYILTGNRVVLVMVGILILHFLNIHPTKKKLVRQLDLSSQEADQFE